jgi:hypothetical protein
MLRLFQQPQANPIRVAQGEKNFPLIPGSTLPGLKKQNRTKKLFLLDLSQRPRG